MTNRTIESVAAIMLGNINSHSGDHTDFRVRVGVLEPLLIPGKLPTELLDWSNCEIRRIMLVYLVERGVCPNYDVAIRDYWYWIYS